MVPIYVKPPNDLSKARLLNGKDQYRNIITNHKIITINSARPVCKCGPNADSLPLNQRTVDACINSYKGVLYKCSKTYSAMQKSEYFSLRADP